MRSTEAHFKREEYFELIVVSLQADFIIIKRAFHVDVDITNLKQSHLPV